MAHECIADKYLQFDSHQVIYKRFLELENVADQPKNLAFCAKRDFAKKAL